MAFIRDGKNIPLFANTGGVPNMTSTLQGWQQTLTFGLVEKLDEAFQVVEVMENFSFRGVWQPLTMQMLNQKPEGQRDFPWFWCHAEPSLQLQVDWIVTYLGKQWRVMARRDYSLYGYMEYHLIGDYLNLGPTVVTP